MGTLILDFDSTLVPVESLELVLTRAVADDPARVAELEELTRRGMEGELGFRESLEARLRIASPTRADLEALGQEMARALTRGAGELVMSVVARGHSVRIVSGAFREVLLPTGAALGITADRVHGVGANWAEDGSLAGLGEDGFATSKVEGARALADDWPRPIVAVGDGATDAALADAGIADTFVAFTGHVRRGFVDASGPPEVGDMAALSALLETLLP